MCSWPSGLVKQTTTLVIFSERIPMKHRLIYNSSSSASSWSPPPPSSFWAEAETKISPNRWHRKFCNRNGIIVEIKNVVPVSFPSYGGAFRIWEALVSQHRGSQTNFNFPVFNISILLVSFLFHKFDSSLSFWWTVWCRVIFYSGKILLCYKCAGWLLFMLECEIFCSSFICEVLTERLWRDFC